MVIQEEEKMNRIRWSASRDVVKKLILIIATNFACDNIGF